MFTGLVEAVGRVAGVEDVASGRRLRFQTSLSPLAPGDSVSVNGVCLTATDAMLERANLSFGDYRIPVDSLLVSAALEEGVLKLSQLNLAALRGNFAVVPPNRRT